MINKNWIDKMQGSIERGSLEKEKGAHQIQID